MAGHGRSPNDGPCDEDDVRASRQKSSPFQFRQLNQFGPQRGQANIKVTCQPIRLRGPFNRHTPKDTGKIKVQKSILNLSLDIFFFPIECPFIEPITWESTAAMIMAQQLLSASTSTFYIEIESKLQLWAMDRMILMLTWPTLLAVLLTPELSAAT